MARMPEGNEPGQGFKLILSDSEQVVEANWELMQAEGYRPYWTGTGDEAVAAYRQAIAAFGPDNVMRGDAYYDDEARPLRHMPGTTIYVRDNPQPGSAAAPMSRDAGT